MVFYLIIEVFFFRLQIVASIFLILVVFHIDVLASLWVLRGDRVRQLKFHSLIPNPSTEELKLFEEKKKLKKRKLK
ncbi:uncharacterized protein LOC131656469 isoform X2 [Vicia villosa]|uniref:uncharacterized protein LOC131656469 isoform X2 n=1 Tax=Vicia villosa TaxID=3911 RepID=UPI00273BA6CD|nr:uncharacterized protein LOC131656469 isoform X2 [Vicia villosa]